MPRKRKPSPNPPGRPPVEIDLAALTALAKIGCTKEEAASVLGCGHRTLMTRLAKDEATAEAWDTGVRQKKVSLRRLQWRHAQGSGGSAVNMTIHMSKHHLGEVDRSHLRHDGAIGHYDVSKASDKDLAELDKILTRIAGSASS